MENIDEGSAIGDRKQTSIQGKRQLAIEHYIKCLAHAYKCEDVDCRFHDCLRMKIVIQHWKRCTKHKIANQECPVCKQLCALCYLHARHCQVASFDYQL